MPGRQAVYRGVDGVLGVDVDADGRVVENEDAGSVASHLASTTRCWFPPDNVLTAFCGSANLDARGPDPAPAAPSIASAQEAEASVSRPIRSSRCWLAIEWSMTRPS